ncbi:hypothetical protein H2200_003263 [Cladophialophora chaetospira]|uniref:Cytochrome P450 n=1 Tax=Cladophialophora chaetospira TaxID=386627 RepID=A0AA38XHQ7_9EURO|nr:hypothetical protein H2200_003263 [Cladophialophora chaetospira]
MQLSSHDPPSAVRSILLVSVLLLLATLVKLYLNSRRPKHFPPGPAPFPIIGNLPELPPTKAFLKFHEWGKQYGDIIGLKFGPQNVVILNNYKHIKELFDKRGAIYSSRPESYVGNQLVCPGEIHVLLIPYSPAWRKLRKCFHQLMTVSSVDALLSLQAAEATKTVHDIINDPEGYYNHLRRFASGVMLASTYGKRGRRFEDKVIQDLYAVQHDFTEVLAPGFMPPADEFPILKYIPEWIAGWKRKARAVGRAQMKLYRSLLEEGQERAQKGELKDCFLKTLIKDRNEGKNELNEAQLAYVAGIFTLRWRPVAPGGVPHVLTEDNVYGQYMIPKGTMLLANTWSIHQDESEYDNPSEFRPERFLDNKFGSIKKESDGENERRRTTYAFGAGRRVCAGQRLAENGLEIAAAKIVWAFDIVPSAPIDSSIESAYTDGFVVVPKRYAAKFVPRAKERASIVAKEAEEAERFLSRFD